jgi:mRNA interferase HigB
MHVITAKRLDEFALLHPDASSGLRVWEYTVTHETFRAPHDVKRLFASASFLANNVVVFNIGGRGKGYRLVVRMSYPKTVFIRAVLTHDEYERRCRSGTTW